MIETIEFRGEHFPLHTAAGFASQFAFPFAEKICKGIGYDIGCNRKEWALPGSIPIDPALPGCTHDAMNLPMNVDFIFSSHCLEHLPDWVGALDYWQTRLNVGGVLFLYLPHPAQTYWLPWNNRKHIHSLSPELMEKYFRQENSGWRNIFVTPGHDLNFSFYAVAEKI
jgi:SAM-dependent methyltransferase